MIPDPETEDADRDSEIDQECEEFGRRFAKLEDRLKETELFWMTYCIHFCYYLDTDKECYIIPGKMTDCKRAKELKREQLLKVETSFGIDLSKVQTVGKWSG